MVRPSCWARSSATAMQLDMHAWPGGLATWKHIGASRLQGLCSTDGCVLLREHAAKGSTAPRMPAASPSPCRRAGRQRHHSRPQSYSSLAVHLTVPLLACELVDLVIQVPQPAEICPLRTGQALAAHFTSCEAQLCSQSSSLAPSAVGLRPGPYTLHSRMDGQ